MLLLILTIVAVAAVVIVERYAPQHASTVKEVLKRFGLVIAGLFILLLLVTGHPGFALIIPLYVGVVWLLLLGARWVIAAVPGQHQTQQQQTQGSSSSTKAWHAPIPGPDKNIPHAPLPPRWRGE
jgi:hypothetical protein